MTGIVGRIPSRNKIVGSITTVEQGGTGVSTITDGGIMLGTGTLPITSSAALGDSVMIVGDGTTTPAYESGSTLRTSIGLGNVDDDSTATIQAGTTKANVGLGSVENTALSTWAGTSNITTLGTVTAGNLSNTAIVYPSGHLIKKTILSSTNVGTLGSGAATPASLISGDYVTLLASSASYLEIVFYSPATVIFNAYGEQKGYLTATEGSHTTTYNADNLIRHDGNTDYTMNRSDPDDGVYWLDSTMIQLFGADPYPNTETITSWSAGDTIRFQIYGSSDHTSGDFTIARNDYWRGFWVNEYKI